jgi:FHS family glucose/mannose:H+ symporter-like MFS transporter
MELQAVIKKQEVFKTTFPSQRLITSGAFLAFFLFGFADNLKGPTLPAVLQDLGLSYSLGGTLVLGAYFGFLVATLLTGPLSDLAGNKMVIFVASACLFLGIVGYSSFSSAAMLIGTMTVLGLGLGSLEVGSNLIIVDTHPHDKGRYLNLLAFFHGVGSMVAPLYAGQLLNAGVSWRRVYQSSLIIVILLFLYFVLVKYPKSERSGSSGLNMKVLGKSVFTGEMLLFYFIIAVYVAAEIGIGSWLVEFLQQSKSQSVLTSSRFLALFFAAITVGRFIGSFIVERIGYLKIMLYASLASVACLAIGTFAPSAFAFFLPLTGLFFSIIFPTTTAAVSDLHKENAGTILGLLFTFGGIGGMFGPWTIGLTSDWLGIHTGFAIVTLLCIATSAAFWLLRRTIRQQ